MNDGKRIITVHTSCSPELKKEQVALWEILEELKAEWRQKKGILLHFNPFQTGSSSLESKQFDYDIFIGVVWTSFSQDTHPSGSATFDDFYKAYLRYSNPADHARISFFIKDYPIPPSKVDGEGLHRLQKFLNPIKDKRNLCSFYYDRDDFSRLIKQYLNRQLSTLSSQGAKDIRKQEQKPIRDISHVLYRLAHNSETLEDYLLRLSRLLGLYFNSSSAKAILLEIGNSNIRYIAYYDGTKNILLTNKEEIGAMSLEESKLIKGDVVTGPRIIGYPLYFDSLIGGIIVTRNQTQEAFKDCHRSLLSFIAEQTALSTVCISK